eukprot:3272622-Pleurochrysis_carterae.AAC.1
MCFEDDAHNRLLRDGRGSKGGETYACRSSRRKRASLKGSRQRERQSGTGGVAVARAFSGKR